MGAADTDDASGDQHQDVSVALGIGISTSTASKKLSSLETASDPSIPRLKFSGAVSHLSIGGDIRSGRRESEFADCESSCCESGCCESGRCESGRLRVIVVQQRRLGSARSRHSACFVCSNRQASDGLSSVLARGVLPRFVIHARERLDVCSGHRWEAEL